MEQFRLDPTKETAQTACDELAPMLSAETEEEVLPAIVEIFREGEKVQIDEYGRLPYQPPPPFTKPYKIDYANIPLNTFVRLEEPFRLLKKYLSSREYEAAVIRVYEYLPILDPLMKSKAQNALSEIGSLKAARVMKTELLNCRDETQAAALIAALSAFGHKHLKELMGGLFLPITEANITRYQKDILIILAKCGDKSCVETILKVSRDGSTVADQARKTLFEIKLRDPSVELPDHWGSLPDWARVRLNEQNR
jgi:hypothetical protein